MGGYAPRTREDSVRPRRLVDASGRPLDFTVRRHSLSIFVLLSAILRRLLAQPIRVGTLYSVVGGKGYFQVVKVLAVDSGGVHVRLYKNRFGTRPKIVDFATLTLGSIHDPDGCGLGHVPLTATVFQAWNPEVLAESPVAEAELDGYREWESAKGGYFGTRE